MTRLANKPQTFMKITSILKKQSNEYWTAFQTDTRVTQEIAKLFQELYAQRTESGSIQVAFQDSYLQMQGTNFPPGFTDFVSQVLTQAEGMVAHQKDIERQKQDIAESEKTDALKRIAERQKLPIV
jgi:hypothetical protein